MLLVYVLALVIGALLSNGENPGFRVSITDKGLDYVRQIGIPILVQQLSDISIPDINGKAGSPIGKIDYSLSSIKGSGFAIPSSSLSVAAGKGISVSASGASVHVSANWHYRMESWPHVSDSGSCDISVSSVSLQFVADVGADSKGHATLTTGGCSCNVGHMSITFHGGASWLYNLFSGSIADSLKGSLASQVCSAGTQAINDQGNKALESLPVTVNLDKFAEIDYRLLAAPTYTSSYMEAEHKGEFFLRAHPTEAPFTVPQLPAITSSDHMMYLWLTDYMADTAGYVYQQTGLLQYTVYPSMVPPSVQKLFALNTSNFRAFLPELYDKCPGCAMILKLNNTEPTTVKITPSGITGIMPGTVTVNVTEPKTNTSEEMFVLSAVVHFAATLSAKENGTQPIIAGNATYLSTDLSLLSSNIGNFSVKGLADAMNVLCTIGVIPYINKYAAAGIPLPIVDGVSLVNPSIVLGQDFVQIATDFSYKPTFFSDQSHFVRARIVD